MRILPKKLSRGDRVAVVCPSSPMPEDEFSQALERVEGLGLVPVVGESCRGRRGYLAAESDEVKAGDIHRAFADDTIAGIICARGGSGAGRLLPLLVVREIARRPKIFAGYSDITALHAFFARSCNMLTLHAPTASSKNLGDEANPTREAFIRAAMSDEPLGTVCDSLTAICPGSARGELVGGNLAVLVTTLGTRWEVETAGKILFIEDIDEEPYSIDRMLAHMRNAGKFEGVAGVVLGDFTRCGAREPESARPLADIFSDYFGRFSDLGVPVAYGLPSGHGDVNVALPLGAVASLDAARGTLSFDERHLA